MDPISVNVNASAAPPAASAVETPAPVEAEAPAPVAAEPVQTETTEIKKSRLPKLKLSKKGVLIGLAALLLAALGGFLYWRYASAQQKLSQSNTQQAAKSEVDALVGKVGKLVALPGDETPTVATVVDAAKLKSQAFFSASENGDKVLMYTKAKKAYLYRPSANLVIEVAPIDIGKNAGATQQPAPAPASKPAPKR